MENNEMLEQTNETENVDTQSTEQNVEGIDLTDTAETEDIDNQQVDETEEEKEKVKTLKELLSENPNYQDEFNTMIKNRLDRKDKELQKALAPFKDVETVLNTGLQTNSIDEAGSKLREFYKTQGIDLPDPVKPGLSDREQQILGEAEANDIIEIGIDEVRSEANRLADKGRDKWTKKEEAMFNKLATTLNRSKQIQELKSIGVDKQILDSSEFQKFANQFNSNADVKNIYNLYSKQNIQKQEKFEKIGSVKTTPTNEVKEFYTFDESLKFTKEDYDKNPALFKAVESSMAKW